MENSFEEFWSELKQEAKKEWSLLEEDVEKINGDFDKFVMSMKEKYKLSELEAQQKAKELYDDLDTMKWEGTADMVKGRAQEVLGEISDDNWEEIKGSKTKILGYLKHHLGKSGQEAFDALEKLKKK